MVMYVFDDSNLSQEIFAIDTKRAVICCLGHGRKHMLTIRQDYMETRLLCGYYFLYFICFHIQKQLILHTLAINIKVLTELRLGILNMPHQIVGQVGIKI